MSMSRKDYRLIAEGLKESLSICADSKDGRMRANGVSSSARLIAERLKRDNPRFRYDVFYAACGLDMWGDVI